MVVSFLDEGAAAFCGFSTASDLECPLEEALEMLLLALVLPVVVAADGFLAAAAVVSGFLSAADDVLAATLSPTAVGLLFPS